MGGAFRPPTAQGPRKQGFRRFRRELLDFWLKQAYTPPTGSKIVRRTISVT
jgi:hypothetical protein